MRSFFAFLFLLISFPAIAKAPKVVATFLPIHSLVAGVMEDVSKVNLLVTRANDSHHGYELRPSEMKILKNADIVFWVSPELETFVPKALQEAAPNAVSVPLMEKTPDLTLLPLSDGRKGNDPHIWMDPNNALKMIDVIEATLSQKDPANANKYKAGAKKAKSYIEELKKLKLQNQKETIVSLHGGFPYLFDYFSINGTALGIDVDTLTGPKTIRETQKKLKTLHPECLIIEPTMKKKEIKLLTNDAYKTIKMDLMGWKLTAGPGLYTNMIRRDVDRIKKCLNDK